MERDAVPDTDTDPLMGNLARESVRRIMACTEAPVVVLMAAPARTIGPLPRLRSARHVCDFAAALKRRGEKARCTGKECSFSLTCDVTTGCRCSGGDVVTMTSCFLDGGVGIDCGEDGVGDGGVSSTGTHGDEGDDRGEQRVDIVVDDGGTDVGTVVERVVIA